MNSTMSEEPDALSVVNQLRDLAADPLNRRAIVQDQGCLPGLILFLDHPNPPVVHSALLALRYLAECRANREKMKSELGMMLSLQNVIQKTTTPGETKLLASEVYDILQSSNMSDMDNVNEMNYRRRKAQFFLGSTNKRAKTVVLHIDGLDDSSRRNLCEEALLKIKGVISFTFQMAVQRCVVRIRSDLKAEALATAIASTKVMKAQQVVKSESGEEMLVPFQDTPVEVEQNTDLPEYLPEDESPTKEQDKAVSRVGSHPEGGTEQNDWSFRSLERKQNITGKFFTEKKGLIMPMGCYKPRSVLWILHWQGSPKENRTEVILPLILLIMENHSQAPTCKYFVLNSQLMQTVSMTQKKEFLCASAPSGFKPLHREHSQNQTCSKRSCLECACEHRYSLP
uniref:Armadillo repeat-containing protein 1 n=1 Tax=Anser cygnoides TaxID=8845 RepID=A0A8B9IKK1_ANSCY